AAEGAVDDVDRPVLELVEHPDRAAAHVRAGVGADVVEEAGVDGAEAAAADEDRAAAVLLAPGVAVDEGQVLHDEARVILVVAVRGGPVLGLVAGVLIEDPAR